MPLFGFGASLQRRLRKQGLPGVGLEGVRILTSKQFTARLRKLRDAFVRELRRDEEPCTTWDINNGSCDVFADRVFDSVPGVEVRTDDDRGHVWIFWQGRHYDAQNTSGVENHTDLVVYKHQHDSREHTMRACKNARIE